MFVASTGELLSTTISYVATTREIVPITPYDTFHEVTYLVTLNQGTTSTVGPGTPEVLGFRFPYNEPLSS